MNKTEVIKRIKNDKIIAIIRSNETNNLEEISRALINSSIRIFEISFNTPKALFWIEKTSEKFGNEAIIGAGTVIDDVTAIQSINAGAKFIVSPIFKKSIVKICLRYNIVSIQGALTCNEALEASELGADFIKIFPADCFGPKYIKAIKAPLPQLSIIPVGGIDLNNAKNFLDNGSDAIAVGSSLISNKDIVESNYDSIMKKARNFVELLNS